jgi:hypothetical protein
VQFGVHEAQPFAHARALDAGGGHEGGGGREFAEILQYGDVFGEDFPALDLQRRHLAARVDLKIVAAVGGRLCLAVDAGVVGRKACFVERDARGERAGQRREEEFHGEAPFSQRSMEFSGGSIFVSPCIKLLD